MILMIPWEASEGTKNEEKHLPSIGLSFFNRQLRREVRLFRDAVELTFKPFIISNSGRTWELSRHKTPHKTPLGALETNL
jgi:hypothetical protein